MSLISITFFTFAFALSITQEVLAHASFKDSEGGSGEIITNAFKIGHGCDGMDTDIITIKMHPDVIWTKPEQTPGYEISTTMRAVDPPQSVFGYPVTETIDTIVFTGLLPDDQFRYFGFSTKLPEVEVDTILPFVIEQNCNGTIMAWNETEENAERPAPTLTVIAPVAAVASAEIESSDALMRSNTFIKALGFMLAGVYVVNQF